MIDAKIARRAVLAGLAASCAAPAAAAPEFDAAQFGFRVSPGGNALAQERMRLHAVANPGSVYRFAPGVYDLTTPRFLFGVRDIEIHAHGASFRNVNAGTFGYSDLDAAFYIGSGSLFHPMGGGNLDPSQATSGDLIRDALAGERAVALRAPERAAAFAPGSWALVHWFSRQQRSFPPNPGYFDYVKILAADPARGTLALDRPLQFAYRARAPDDLSDAGLYNVATGRARILSLQRHDYQICERFVLRGGRGVATGFGKAPPNPYDGIIEVAGAIDVELHDVEFQGFFPSMLRSVRVFSSRFTGGSELDKIIEQVEMTDCTVTDITQGTGVRAFAMQGGRLQSSGRPEAISQIRARSIALRGVDIASRHPREGGWQVSVDAFAKTAIEVDGCTFRPGPGHRAAFAPGDGVVFTPDAVTPAGMVVGPRNPAWREIIVAVDFASTISRVAGPDPHVFTVADMTFDSAGALVLSGGFDRAAPFESGAAWLLRSVGRFIDRGNNRIADPPPGFNLLPITRAIAQPQQGPPAEPRTLVFQLAGGQFHAALIQGYIASLTVDVEIAYGGSDPVAALEITKLGPGRDHDFGTIDVRRTGLRRAAARSAAGAAGADKWGGLIPEGLWVELLHLHLHGSARAKFNDGQNAVLPRISVGVSAFRNVPA